MDKFFKLNERNTNVKTEIIAGLTTFLSMSYILIVNPLTLADAGMPADAVFSATIFAAIIGTLIMGLYANYPVALAPGMGMNAFFAYTVVSTLGYSWQEALFGIFVSGLIFILMSLTGLREKIISAIPASLKYATSAGIGFFIAFIGLQSAQIIVANPATLVSFGDITSPSVILSLIGLCLMFFFHSRNNNFSIIISMIIITILGYVFKVSELPQQIVSAPPSIEPIFGQLFTDINIFNLLTDITFWTIIFSFLFVDFFDTTGTLIAVGSEAGFIDEKGELKDSKKALLADAVATTTGAVLGTSSVTSYVESLSGIKSGGRTGLTAVSVAFFLALSLFFSPILTSIASYVTAPTLIMVGTLMASNKAKIDYSDYASSASAFLTMLMMVVTYSIAQGIAFGFLSYSLIKIFQGKAKDLSIILIILDFIFLLYFINL